MNYVKFILLLIIAVLLRYEWLAYVFSSYYTVTYLIRHLKKYKFENINIIFVYSFSITLVALANVIAVLSKDTSTEFLYFLYADPDFIYEASLIFFVGNVMIINGFESGSKKTMFPKLYPLRSIKYTYALFPLSLMVVFFKSYLPSLGSLSNLVTGVPLFSIFYLCNYGIRNEKRGYVFYAVIIAVLATVDAILNSYLRSEMIQPVIFFFIGYLSATKSVRSLLQLKFVPVYLFLGVFLTYFSLFGETRSTIGSGAKRIERIIQTKAEVDKGTEIIEGTSPLARMTDFNQVTQVASLVDKEGFFKGESLEYLSYVFIPRFIWPDKPLIQQGAWFAEKINLGWRDDSGVYHNSINMTVPGEFYMNFGFLGVVLGCFTFGFLLSQFWNATNFNDHPNSIPHNLFSAYLLQLGFFTIGADLQIIVTILALYLLFLFISRVLS